MDLVTMSGKGRLLVKAKRSNREISQRSRDEFIVSLSETCNVSLSAERAGVALSTVYKMRQRDAAFAAAWQRALDDGYQRLEMGLVQAALAAVEGPGPDVTADSPAIAPMTVDQALRLLGRHEGSVRSGRFKTNRPGKGRMPTSEETDEAILKRLAILRRQRGWDKL
jgi:hypothetical protein